jgi:outer membrane protein assembly factor BamB
MHEGGLEYITTRTDIEPIVYENFVIVSYSSGDVYCLNLENGQEFWRYSISNLKTVLAPSLNPVNLQTLPIIHDGFIYFATSMNKLVKIHLASGSIAWERVAHDILSLDINGDYLIITSNARQLSLINKYSEKVAGVVNLMSELEAGYKKIPPVHFMKPFVYESLVNGVTQNSIGVVGSNGNLYSFSLENGRLPTWPTSIAHIPKNVRYQMISCCGCVTIFTKNQIHFFLSKKSK